MGKAYQDVRREVSRTRLLGSIRSGHKRTQLYGVILSEAARALAGRAVEGSAVLIVGAMVSGEKPQILRLRLAQVRAKLRSG